MIVKISNKIKREVKNKITFSRIKKKTKYFCIGRNKTGTTSLKKAFEELNFIVGNQRKAEILYDNLLSTNHFNEIIKYCKTAEVFQDVPFSYFEIVEYLDKAYPNSKFILTVRNDAEQWYNSITKFHAKKFGENGRLPTSEDLAAAEYVRKGWMLNTIKDHGTSLVEPYNKEIMCAHYNKHNADVLNYFKNRPDQLLIINLAEKDSYGKFLNFINCESERIDFPWENKT